MYSSVWVQIPNGMDNPTLAEFDLSCDNLFHGVPELTTFHVSSHKAGLFPSIITAFRPLYCSLDA